MDLSSGFFHNLGEFRFGEPQDRCHRRINAFRRFLHRFSPKCHHFHCRFSGKYFRRFQCRILSQGKTECKVRMHPIFSEKVCHSHRKGHQSRLCVTCPVQLPLRIIKRQFFQVERESCRIIRFAKSREGLIKVHSHSFHLTSLSRI